MGFLGLSKKRNDGKLVKGGDPMMHIMPYVMRGRNESAVYYQMTVPVGNIQKYIIEKRKEGERITLFNVVVAALLRTINERPKINRFVAGRRLYEHNNFEVLYVVKQQMTEEGVESVCKVKLERGDTIFDVKNTMDEHTKALKRGELEGDDKLIRHLAQYPRWIIRLLYRVLLWLDFNGMMPKALIEMLPFYSTIFVSHLGTFGANALFHHLYEFGTTSIFMTIGRIYEKPFKGPNDEVDWKRVIDLDLTIDERICGFDLVRALRLFETYLDDPWALEKPYSDEKPTPRHGDIFKAQINTSAEDNEGTP